MKAKLLLACAAFLAGCAAEPARLAVDLPISEARVRPSVDSILVGEVTLPDYANAAEVARQDESGLIAVIPGVIWADTPTRALSASLVRNLSAITRRQVAGAPWPLEESPQSEVTVRVERMLVTRENILQMSGQYAVRSLEGRESLRRFDVAVPVPGEDLPALASAHASAWQQVAEEIADGL